MPQYLASDEASDRSVHAARMRATLRAGTTGCAVFLPAVKTIMQYLTIHTGSERKSVSERNRERGCRRRGEREGREVRKVGAAIGDTRGGGGGDFLPSRGYQEERQVVSSSFSFSLPERSPAIAVASCAVSCLDAAFSSFCRCVSLSPSPSPTSSFSTLPGLCLSLSPPRAWCKLLGASHPASSAFMRRRR